ncbi:MAG: AAA family ATPase [bacterium]
MLQRRSLKFDEIADVTDLLYEQATTLITAAVTGQIPLEEMRVKLRKIDLKDCRGLNGLVIDIHENVTLVVGTNGIGKSTILYAIAKVPVKQHYLN